LVQAAAEGKLDDLRCPLCECHSVSVYYTRPAATEYHTWFVCSACEFSMRAQNSVQPAFYSPDRDRTGKKTVVSSNDKQ